MAVGEMSCLFCSCSTLNPSPLNPTLDSLRILVCNYKWRFNYKASSYCRFYNNKRGMTVERRFWILTPSDLHSNIFVKHSLWCFRLPGCKCSSLVTVCVSVCDCVWSVMFTFVSSYSVAKVCVSSKEPVLLCWHDAHMSPPREQKKGLTGGFKKNLDMLDNNNTRTPPTTHAPVLRCDVIKAITQAKRHGKQLEDMHRQSTIQ